MASTGLLVLHLAGCDLNEKYGITEFDTDAAIRQLAPMLSDPDWNERVFVDFQNLVFDFGGRHDIDAVQLQEVFDEIVDRMIETSAEQIELAV